MSDHSSPIPTAMPDISLVEDNNNHNNQDYDYNSEHHQYIKTEPEACFESMDDAYPPALEDYSDVMQYTTQNLTTLEPYRPESNSISPPMYTKMNPVSYTPPSGGQSSDDAAVVPIGVSPIDPMQDGGSSPIEDYRNLACITPTLFEFKKEQQSVFYTEDMESLASSSSPASSSTSSASWLQTTQVIDDPKNSLSVKSPSDVVMPTDQFDISSAYWECVNCGTMASEADVWFPDKTGHFLCSQCNERRKITFNFISDKSPKQKFKKSNLQNILERLSPIPGRAPRVNSAKKMNQVCSNCHTSNTSLWRRSNLGETVCNACGLYYKLHKRSRPITMRKDSIQKRKRKPKVQKSKLVGPGMLTKYEENSSSIDPPSYSSHLAMTTGLPRSYESMYTSNYHSLPSVHSPNGFSNQLPQYGLASAISSPLQTSYTSSSPTCYSSTPPSISPPNVWNCGPHQSNPSPTIASLLQSTHPYIPFGDTLHSSSNLQAVYTV